MSKKTDTKKNVKSVKIKVNKIINEQKTTK